MLMNTNEEIKMLIAEGWSETRAISYVKSNIKKRKINYHIGNRIHENEKASFFRKKVQKYNR